MPSQKVQFMIKGMSRDLADSKFNPEFAFENKNIRITPTENSTLLVLSNEKGNAVIDTHTKYKGVNRPITNRKVLGYTVLYKTIVLFFKGTYDGVEKDYISTIKRNDIDTEWEETILYFGNLNFNEEQPIEALPLYEAEDIQKVYWVDGINQPRVINIYTDEDHIIRENDDTQFDFLPTVGLTENITISRYPDITGQFPSGTLQYIFTYSKKNGQESKIIWISKLYYTTFENRAGSPDELTPASYHIVIKRDSIDYSFDKINIYSIIRTSEDAGLQTKLVTRIDIAAPSENDNSDYEYIDTNASGETVAPTDLLYKGGEELIANTLATKDNTLFLGNLRYNSNFVPDTIKADARDTSKVEIVSSESYEIEGWKETVGYYPYKNPLLQEEVTYLKAGNKYRLGLQLQDSRGGWSEPIFVQDYLAYRRPVIDDNNLLLPKIKLVAKSAFISECIEAGYKKIRPIVVYPSVSERGVIAQGIVAASVFRKESRLANNPFAQSSWFFRPYNAYGYESPYADNKYSVEARHGHALPAASKYNAEIQCATEGGWATSTSGNTTNYFIDGSIVTFHSPDVNDNLQESELLNSNLKVVGAFAIDSVSGRLRLIDTGPAATFEEEYGKTYGKVRPDSLYNVNKVIESPTSAGSAWTRNLFTTQTLWKDAGIKAAWGPGDSWFEDCYFATYPWQRSCLWLETSALPGVDFSSVARITNKIISNIRISQNFQFYNASDEYLLENGLRDRRIFRQENTDSGYVIKAATNRSSSCNFDALYYKGGENSSIVSDEYYIYGAKDFNGTLLNLSTEYSSQAALYKTQDLIPIHYKSTDHIVLALENDASGRSVQLPVPEFLSTDPDGSKTQSQYSGNLFWLSNTSDIIYEASSSVKVIIEDYPASQLEDGDTVIKVSDDSQFPYTLTFWRYVSGAADPFVSDSILNNYTVLDLTQATFEVPIYGMPSKLRVSTADNGHTWTATSAFEYDKVKALPSNIYSAAVTGKEEVMWITELVREIPSTIFGGDSEYAIKNNQWLPCGEATIIPSTPEDLNVYLNEGDTIFNRWDCVKTLPYSTEDVNQIVEIMSFMCESYTNTAGRYDKNRGLQDYTFLNSGSSFNLMNPAYNNKDNFFTYRISDLEENKNSEYPNLVTWSLTKTLGEEIDSWTHISLASTLDMDGDRGKIRALKRYKNSIFAFQDRGIAEIIYNPTTAIASTTGVPIEIANSGKVEGKRYVSENVGCTNKWSICTTPAGIYFVDSINKKVYLWSDNGMTCLSEQFGFTSWFNSKIERATEGWYPEGWDVKDDFIIQYDRTVGDVYFINNDSCLTFNESLGQFSSFYNYEKTPFFINLDTHCLTVRDNNIWEQHSGEYNSFFGVNNRPYYTEVVVNPNPTEDKVFDNIEFRADSWEGNTLLDSTFDWLEAHNEYQQGEWELTWLRGYPSTLKKKFRVWYANIPRNTSNLGGDSLHNYSRDRMRNTWIHLRLSKLHPGTERTVLHDLQVKYFI